MPMILRSAPPSPFGRKVRIAAAVLGLEDAVSVMNADTNDPGDTLHKQNPLGKIPALIMEDDAVLYDSRVIIEYLDAHAGGGKVIPASGAARYEALRQQALADGIMDAGILQIYEKRFRPEEMWHQPWLDKQAARVESALKSLESDRPDIGETPTIGAIATACALGYLDFRFEGAWRENHPELVEWLDAFASAVPAYETTKPAA